ncbi:MAG TPA: methylmalonyl-CoA mutase family protein, partial [Xanthobacteraceae bacterium]
MSGVAEGFFCGTAMADSLLHRPFAVQGRGDNALSLPQPLLQCNKNGVTLHGQVSGEVNGEVSEKRRRDEPMRNKEQRDGREPAQAISAEAARDKPWIFRTYAGHSTARASNALYRKNLSKGQTGLSV